MDPVLFYGMADPQHAIRVVHPTFLALHFIEDFKKRARGVTVRAREKGSFRKLFVNTATAEHRFSFPLDGQGGTIPDPHGAQAFFGELRIPFVFEINVKLFRHHPRYRKRSTNTSTRPPSF